MTQQSVLSESLYKTFILYGPEIQTLLRDDDCFVFKMENDILLGEYEHNAVCDLNNFSWVVTGHSSKKSAEKIAVKIRGRHTHGCVVCSRKLDFLTA